MGRFFFECPGGSKIYSCRRCKTFLSNIENMISDRSTGVAWLFDSVINIDLSNVEEKVMLTGRHMVRDAFCKNCKSRVGWMYEFAHDPQQVYKEGKVILEKALIEESQGMDDKLALMPSATTMTLHGLSPVFNSGSSYASLTPTNSTNTTNSSVTIAAQFSRNSSTSSFESTNSSPEEDRHRTAQAFVSADALLEDFEATDEIGQ
uniref:Yippee domain-containing protein n=1 Tax=Ditylenchus dipsaci TaxID=166011 RepID=A0A915EF71_9BILA